MAVLNNADSFKVGASQVDAIYLGNNQVWTGYIPLAGGANDSTFATYDFANRASTSLSSVAIQSDDKIVISGQFLTYNGVLCNRIIRLNSDGTVDLPFMANVGTAASGTSNPIAIQPDGKILLGGSFVTWNGVTVNRIVRLNSDGTRDTAFTTNTGTASSTFVNAIAVQPDGKILIGGVFTTWNGVTRNYIVRLNSDGTEDTAFYANTGTAANNSVVFISVQSDGKIILGGDFTTWNGTTVNRIVRLNSNGTRDTTFTTNTGTGANLSVNTISVQSDGKIILGGVFTTWNGVTVNRIVRLNSDGTRDTAFTTNTGTAATGNINATVIQPDGKILVGGNYTQWNGLSINRIVRLNSDGTLDTTFTTNIGAGANGTISRIALQSNNKIILVGQFINWNNNLVNYSIRLNSDGTSSSTPGYLDGPAAAGSNAAINTLAVQSDNKIIVGGEFATWENITVNRIVRLNFDGTRDTVFTTNVGTAAGVASPINVITVQSDNKILVGGQFTAWNGTTVGRFIRLNSDGTVDTSSFSNYSVGANGLINAIAVQPDGKIILGGQFTTWQGVTRNNILRLNSDGTEDTAFYANTGTAANAATINTIAVQSDGKIVIGGAFPTWNGVTVNRIVRLNSNGTQDSAFTTNTGTAAGTSTINTISVQSDGKIVVGGAFTTWNGTTVNRIVRLNSDGTLDAAFTANTGTGLNGIASTILIQPDGKIVVGGQFLTLNSVTVNRIVRLNSDGTQDTAFTSNTGIGINNSVRSIAYQQGDYILVGGIFNYVNNINRTSIARIGGS